MDRLHTQEDYDVFTSRLQLGLFDTAMNMEVKNYSGPYLPKNSNANYNKVKKIFRYIVTKL